MHVHVDDSEHANADTAIQIALLSARLAFYAGLDISTLLTI